MGRIYLLLTLLLLAGCPESKKAEPLGSTDAWRPHVVMDDDAAVIVADGSRTDTDTTADSLTAADASRPDASRPDTTSPVDTTAPIDRVTPWDTAQPDQQTTPDGFVVADAAGAADSGTGDAAIADRVSEDRSGEDATVPVLPMLRVEVYPYNFNDNDILVDWHSPVDAVCDDWEDPITCDWGTYGQISISGDENGNADPNWAEITGAALANGHYKVRVYENFCDERDTCEVEETKIYLDGQLVRTMTEDVNIGESTNYLCMPVVNGEWAVFGFDWSWSGSCQ